MSDGWLRNKLLLILLHALIVIHHRCTSATPPPSQPTNHQRWRWEEEEWAWRGDRPQLGTRTMASVSLPPSGKRGSCTVFARWWCVYVCVCWGGGGGCLRGVKEVPAASNTSFYSPQPPPLQHLPLPPELIVTPCTSVSYRLIQWKKEAHFSLPAEAKEKKKKKERAHSFEAWARIHQNYYR